ncbi:MAG: DUF4093 domain-containing protein [Oscillospiraceae bacterium]|nr:DUF4093 domain-containing protein [Oscillospiraceae bacterium]
MQTIKEVIIVEGRYDKNTLSQVVRATILETRGYGLFSDKQKLQLIRRLAKERGVIVLTDSDQAGFLIRNHLRGSVPEGRVLHAYIPDRAGKERRKTRPGKEGKLGVEGMDASTLLEALRRAGATFGVETSCEITPSPSVPPLQGGELAGPQLTKAHLFEAGLTGGVGSREKRLALLRALDLPENLTTNGLLEMLNVLYGYEEALRVIGVE